MPYKYGHYFVAFVLFVTVTGFWASYFSMIGGVPLAFHVHAFTAASWLLLLLVQSLAIHRRMNGFHRIMGQASFVMFPLLITGFVMIINLSATRFATQENPFIAVVGPAFGIGMTIAIAAYLTLFYQAMRHRRNIRLHAGYLLATPMILFESPFSRLMEKYFPWMNVIGSEGPRGVLDMILVSNVLVAALALVLYARDRRQGAPWLVATAFLIGEGIVMWIAPDVRAFDVMFAAYARIPHAVTVAIGFGAGALVAWLGWQRGTAAARRPVQARAA